MLSTISQKEFLRTLLLCWHKAGQPDTKEFVTKLICGCNMLSKRELGKTYAISDRDRYLKSRERKERMGMCLRCGVRKPDGIRSQKYCDVCLDGFARRQKTYKIKRKLEA